jgi:hypothetical protein
MEKKVMFQGVGELADVAPKTAILGIEAPVKAAE